MGWGNNLHRLAAELACALLLAACSPRGVTANRYADNWQDLCAIADCEQFPAGYVTTRIGDYAFYEPIAEAGNSHLPGASHYYVQLNADGSMRRAAMVNPTGTNFSVGHPCCDRLAERFNLPRPQIAGYVGNMGFRFYAVRRNGPSIQERRRAHVQFRSLEDLQALKLPDFDDNFWLVEAGEINEGPHLERTSRDYLLISKRPLLLGRHVWADCGVFCDVDTFAFPADPRPYLPHATVSGMIDNRHRDGVSCNRDGQSCIPTQTPYDAIPAGLAWVEDLIEALQRKPTDA